MTAQPEAQPTDEQSIESIWQDALIDLAETLTIEQLVRAGVKPKTLYAMRLALESPILRNTL